MMIIPRNVKMAMTMLTNKANRVNKNHIKKLHRLTQAHAEEMKSLSSDSNNLTPEIAEFCDKIYASCDICASTGNPRDKKKVSISHVNEAFNNSDGADFLVARIRGTVYDIINIVDLGTNNGERCIVTNHKTETLVEKFETVWIYNYGAPL